ncbi:c-type cytochrome [Pseudoxanthomonas koreensis]|uniref:c-type cytochrome n=1 Tax=Pseudoxanthomonas koreensis TaxID=266061 RepID=UPI00192EF580|nr:c-type cytochrome [Pseudoxanthomonas koreensis]
MQVRPIRQAIAIALCLASPCLLSACQPAATATVPVAAATPAAAAAPAVDLVARGEYLVRIAGCNDCHTAGYAERQGQVPKEQWLTGSAPLGYNGPWGTTYATNLRLRMQEMDEAQWLEYSAHLRARPIMPDFALREMTEEDRRALYRFIRGLGPAGERAPAALPPGQTPPPPVLALVLPPAPGGATAAANTP